MSKMDKIDPWDSSIVDDGIEGYLPKIERKKWNTLSLMEQFYRTVNEYMLLEMDDEVDIECLVSESICYWWYSPIRKFFTPKYPFKDVQHPMLGTDDWIYMGVTDCGTMVIDGTEAGDAY